MVVVSHDRWYGINNAANHQPQRGWQYVFSHELQLMTTI